VGPVAFGKNLFPTTPLAVTMNRLKTGGALAAHAERSGNPSKKGRPIATAPARKNARRLTAAGRAKGGRAGEPPSGEERW
jgi:hypothetical protein